jgi:hypothetical protein
MVSRPYAYARFGLPGKRACSGAMSAFGSESSCDGELRNVRRIRMHRMQYPNCSAEPARLVI